MKRHYWLVIFKTITIGLVMYTNYKLFKNNQNGKI